MKKLFVALTLCITVALFCLSASAEIVSGYCGGEGDGTNLTWTFDTETGLLEISGSGEMEDVGYYDYYASVMPWFAYRKDIISVKINSGVTTIGNYAFENCTSLVSIDISDSVTTIGNSAFGKCASLVSVNIPDSVTTIGFIAFSDCTSLKKATVYSKTVEFDSGVFYLTHTDFEIHGYTGSTAETYANNNRIPFVSLGSAPVLVAEGTCGDNLTWREMSDGKIYIDGTGDFLDDFVTENTGTGTPADEIIYVIGKDVRAVNSYDAGAFRFQTNVTEFVVDKANPYMTSKDGVLFNKDMTELIVYPGGKKSEEYTVPSGVTRIRARAFERNRYIKTITLPEGLEKIDFAAFYQCGAEKLNVPESITHIGSWSIHYSAPVDFVDKLKNVEYIGDAALYDGLDAWLETQEDGVVYIGKVAFCYKGEMPENTKITLRDGTTQIYSRAFYGQTNLIDIEIPDSVVSVAPEALHGTAWYDSQPDGVVYAGKVAYEYKGDSTNANISFVPGTKGITGNVLDTFKGDTIEIPLGIEHIDQGALWSTATTVILPSTLKHIDRYWNTFSDSIVKIGGEEGSFAEQFAFENGIEFLPIKTYTPGDSDGDGNVTIRDAARILQYKADWDVEINLDASDVDGDGNVTIRDAARILQYKAGWDVTLG